MDRFQRCKIIVPSQKLASEIWQVYYFKPGTNYPRKVTFFKFDSRNLDEELLEVSLCFHVTFSANPGHS